MFLGQVAACQGCFLAWVHRFPFSFAGMYLFLLVWGVSLGVSKSIARGIAPGRLYFLEGNERKIKGNERKMKRI